MMWRETGRALARCALLLWLLLGLVGCVSTRMARPETLEHFHEFVETDDGWQVALFRVPPTAGTEHLPHHGVPVFMAHGTSVNRYNYCYPSANLARFLADRGFDVWLAEYRGDRTSTPPDAATWRAGDWDLDDIAQRDLPALVARARAASGGQKVWWLGHSLGGILGYVYAQGPHGDDLAGLVSIAAPGDFAHPNDMALLLDRFRKILPRKGVIPARALAGLGPLALDLIPESRIPATINSPNNIDGQGLERFTVVGIEDISSGLVRQYHRWVLGGRLTSREGDVDYTAGLARIEVPSLFLAGRVDHIVPAWTVRRAYELVGSQDKQFILLGRAWGTVEDYGHGDLMIGRRVNEEVFPIIGSWLVDRAAETE